MTADASTRHAIWSARFTKADSQHLEPPAISARVAASQSANKAERPFGSTAPGYECRRPRTPSRRPLPYRARAPPPLALPFSPVVRSYFNGTRTLSSLPSPTDCTWLRRNEERA